MRSSASSARSSPCTADRHPARLGLAGGELQRGVDMRAERLSGFVEADRRVEHAAEFLPDEEMPDRRLALAGDLIDLLHEIVGEGAGLRHAVRLLEGLDGGCRRLAERAVEILRRRDSRDRPGCRCTPMMRSR